jgi:hypothetical protein
VIQASFSLTGLPASLGKQKNHTNCVVEMYIKQLT